MPFSARRDLVGLLGGEADSLHPVPEELAQLVLRRDDGNFRAGVGECGQDGAGAQMARVVHHHFLAALRIEEIVAADAVHRRRRPGHDREIVGVGEARHDAVGEEGGAVAREQSAEKGRDPGGDGGRDVLELAAVDADDDQRPIHPAVRSAIDGEGERQIQVACSGGDVHVDKEAAAALCMRARLSAACWRSRLSRLGAVARDDGGDHRFVLGVGDGETAAVLEPAQAEQQQPLGEQPVALRQARIAGEVDQQVVKLQIQRVIRA